MARTGSRIIAVDEPQTQSLEKTLESGVECSAVMQQIAAIRGAANGLMVEVLEGGAITSMRKASWPWNARRTWRKWFAYCVLISKRMH